MCGTRIAELAELASILLVCVVRAVSEASFICPYDFSSKQLLLIPDAKINI